MPTITLIDKESRSAKKFRLLGNPVRLRMLHYLRQPRTAKDLAVLCRTPQRTISNQLGLMRREGIVLVERGKNSTWRLCVEAMAELFSEFLEEISG